MAAGLTAVPPRRGEKGSVATTLVRPTRCGRNRLLSDAAAKVGIGQVKRAHGRASLYHTMNARFATQDGAIEDKSRQLLYDCSSCFPRPAANVCSNSSWDQGLP